MALSAKWLKGCNDLKTEVLGPIRTRRLKALRAKPQCYLKLNDSNTKTRHYVKAELPHATEAHIIGTTKQGPRPALRPEP